MSLSEPITKKRRRDDSEESPLKKRNPLISPELKKILGPILGNSEFLELFQKLYFPAKTLQECAEYIISSSTRGKIYYVDHIISYLEAGILPEVSTSTFLLDIFEKAMNAYTLYMFQKNPSTTTLCLFNEYQLDVKLVRATIENGKPRILSEILELCLVNDGKTFQYVAKLREDIMIHERGLGNVFFESSNGVSNRSVVLGNGSYGWVFKIIGVDGVWYIVKVFYVKEFAEHEWSALKRVMGKHPCLQQGIELQTGRKGDIQHIIVSKYQGDIVLSKIRDSPYQVTLQQFISMFMELLDGINIAHSCGILHCDIKPDNIIVQVNPDGTLRLVLIDFGIAENDGLKTEDPQSHYTSWYRSPFLFLNSFLESFNKNMNTFVDPPTLSRILDRWASFVSFLHVISPPLSDFLGFRSRTENEARKHMILTSRVAQLMLKMKPWIGADNRNIKFVEAIYFVLLNEEGPEKFLETFKSFGINLTRAGMYDEYMMMFKRLRNENPMIAHVKNAFQGVYSEDASFDISEPMKKLIDLFIEILCDGSDLSLLGCLTMDHIQQWVDRLDDSLVELCNHNKRIFFYD